MSFRRTLRLGLCAIVLLAVAPPSPRLVVLIPSFAEDAFAVGANVVGVSRYTDVPQAKGLPAIGDFQSIDSEAIIRLHPDAVIGLPEQARLVEPLRRAGIHVELVADNSLEDIYTDIARIGELSGHVSQATALVARLHRETKKLRASVRPGAAKPSVFFALGTGPVWTVGKGSYIGTLIELAGGRNAAADLRTPYGEYSEEALLRAQPDVIIAGHDTPLHDVLKNEPWKSLRAVRDGHVIEINDTRINDALFHPGPHYNEGLRWLIERLSSL